VIGFLGRLVEEKGLDVAMAALERLDRSLRWSLLVMGSGPYEPAIRAWARRRCCSKRVKIRLVRHERVPRYLAAVDLLLMPSQTRAHWREQFGRAVVEAFAAGVPAIVSDSGALPRTAGDAARLVSEADAGAWAAAIADLLGDASARAELSRRGRQRAQRFSTTAVAGELAAVFTAMSASRTRRRPRQLRA
jgi:glycosyltransferase involved in cell wall biosynthesis